MDTKPVYIIVYAKQQGLRSDFILSRLLEFILYLNLVIKIYRWNRWDIELLCIWYTTPCPPFLDS